MKVIVVDADMRLPNQHKLFDLPNRLGLSSVLTQTSELEESIQSSEMPGLSVLTSGPIPRYPSELLGSYRMGEVITQLSKHFDVILFDTPAFLRVSDPAVLIPFMDAVVLVVSRATSHREKVSATLEQLEGIRARLIGFVLNRAKQDHRDYYRVRKAASLKKTREPASNIVNP